MVTADVSLQELRGYLQRLRIGASSFAILMSREGTILSGRHADNIMRHYSEVPNRLLDITVWREIFQAALAGQTSTRSLQCPEMPGRCTIRLAALQSTGWPVGIVYSQAEILAPLRQFQLKTALIGGVTLLFTCIAVIWVTRRLTRPLVTLAMASDQIARGQLDSNLPTARGNDEIARLIHSFTGMQRDLRRYITDLEQVTASRSRLQGELAAAREIQMSMLPGGGEAGESSADYQLWARVQPAKSVGGDLYTFYRAGRQLLLAVGDVSDKGVPAALFMAKAISLIQQLAGIDTAPDKAMAGINNALEKGNDNCMFVTLFLGVLDLDSLELRFASAGHTAPALLRGSAVEVVEQNDGPALGLAPDLEYACNRLYLHPGDRLAIFTDGIDEAFNSAGDMFGTEAFYRQLQDSARLAIADAGPALIKSVEDYAGDTAQSDDITLLLLDIPVADRDLTGRSQQQFATGAGLVTRVLEWLQATLAELEISGSDSFEVMLVAEELVANIDKYGDLPAQAGIELAVQRSPVAVVLEVRDGGKPFDPLAEGARASLGADIDSADIGGLGVHLITQLTDGQHYRREGGRNVLRVVKKIG